MVKEISSKKYTSFILRYILRIYFPSLSGGFSDVATLTRSVVECGRDSGLEFTAGHAADGLKVAQEG